MIPNKWHTNGPLVLAVLMVLALSLVSCQMRRPDARSDHQWTTYGGDLANDRYSALTQISTRNVYRLVPRYVYQTGIVGAFEASPIVEHGTLFVSSARDGVAALKASDGGMLWKRLPLSGDYRLCCGAVNRGVAVDDSRLFIGQIDGALVALDRVSGAVRWATLVGDNRSGYSITMAPLVYKDLVIVGTAGGEFGIRGSLNSYSVMDGSLKWRWFSTSPELWNQGAPKAAHRDPDGWKHGGGGIWTTPALDETTNMLFATTGNPWPDSDGSRRPGANLYTDSVVALDALTGRLKWYFQEVSHDTDDLDAASPPFLLDADNGKGIRVPAVAQVGKNGSLYVLERSSGHLIRKSQNIAGIDEHGFQSSEWRGGTTWSPVAFDRGRHLAIVCATQHKRAVRGSIRSEAQAWAAGISSVSAINTDTGKIVWQDRFDQGIVGGAVATASGVTFFGEGNGEFDAADTASGALLWRFQTGAGVNAAPIVFETEGAEAIGVASGGNQQFGTPPGDALFVFSLPRF